MPWILRALQPVTYVTAHKSLPPNLNVAVCFCSNNEVQFAGLYGLQGVRYTLAVKEGDPAMLSRQVHMHTAFLLVVRG